MPGRVGHLLSVSLTLLTACERFPEDPQRTLANIKERGSIRVGVIESSPHHMMDESGDVMGAEARLIQSFADALRVDVEWREGHAEGHFEDLREHRLDLVAGGITKQNPWKKHVGFTVPWKVVEGESDRSYVMAVPKGENAFVMRLERHILQNAVRRAP